MNSANYQVGLLSAKRWGLWRGVGVRSRFWSRGERSKIANGEWANPILFSGFSKTVPRTPYFVSQPHILCHKPHILCHKPHLQGGVRSRLTPAGLFLTPYRRYGVFRWGSFAIPWGAMEDGWWMLMNSRQRWLGLFRTGQNKKKAVLW